MRKLCAVVLFLCVLVSGADMARAEQWVSELRIGVLAHDVSVLSFNRESGTDVNAEVLFTSPSWLSALGAPRPHLGGTLNLSGNTSMAYAGLTWSMPLAPGIFVEGMLGGARHDGHLELDDRSRKALGRRFLFRIGAALGLEVTEHINFLLVYDHVSNANLDTNNEGLDMVGVRLGYRF